MVPFQHNRRISAKNTNHLIPQIFCLIFRFTAFCTWSSFFFSVRPCMCIITEETTSSFEAVIPTLKDILGDVPKYSLPVVHHPWKPCSISEISQWRTSASGRNFRSPHLQRRGLSTQETSSMTAQVTGVGFNKTNPLLSWYYIKLQIGTPVQDVLVILDTGSSVLWVQDRNCSSCYDELLPRFSSQISSTFQPEPDDEFSVIYGDGGLNQGICVTDTLVIDSGYGNQLTIGDFEFGLSSINNGSNEFYSGIFGLNPSLVYPTGVTPVLVQLATFGNGTFSKFSKKFRHCFPDKVQQPDATSFLSFGDIGEAETEDLFFSSGKHPHLSRTLWTPLYMTNPLNASDPLPWYTLRMTGIAVAGNRLPIDSAQLSVIDYDTTNFTIIDSGTVMPTLAMPYFILFVKAFLSAMGPNYILNQYIFDNNYIAFNMTAEVFDAEIFPTVSLFFEKWHPQGQKRHGNEEIELLLPKENLFIPILLDDGTTPYMLTVGQSFDNSNTIGNFWQQNFLIEFDLEKLRLGFLRASCAFEY